MKKNHSQVSPFSFIYHLFSISISISSFMPIFDLQSPQWMILSPESHTSTSPKIFIKDLLNLFFKIPQFSKQISLFDLKLIFIYFSKHGSIKIVLKIRGSFFSCKSLDSKRFTKLSIKLLSWFCSLIYFFTYIQHIILALLQNS